jgi:hypothetical protein
MYGQASWSLSRRLRKLARRYFGGHHNVSRDLGDTRGRVVGTYRRETVPGALEVLLGSTNGAETGIGSVKFGLVPLVSDLLKQAVLLGGALDNSSLGVGTGRVALGFGRDEYFLGRVMVGEGSVELGLPVGYGFGVGGHVVSFEVKVLVITSRSPRALPQRPVKLLTLHLRFAV